MSTVYAATSATAAMDTVSVALTMAMAVSGVGAAVAITDATFSAITSAAAALVTTAAVVAGTAATSYLPQERLAIGTNIKCFAIRYTSFKSGYFQNSSFISLGKHIVPALPLHRNHGLQC